MLKIFKTEIIVFIALISIIAFCFYLWFVAIGENVEAQKSGKFIEYVKDKETNLCFATSDILTMYGLYKSIALVPCEKVEKVLINKELK